MLKFIGSNIAYILWFIIYFTIAWVVTIIIIDAVLMSFFIVLLIYTVSVAVALSPIGELLLTASHGCREPATEQEREYLVPIFEEVYLQAKNVVPNLNSGIKLYIMDAMYVNAFAVGRKTIAVTQGMIETFTEEELKGVLAHELGHMRYGHTKALLLSFIGNAFFSIIVAVFRFLLSVVEIISDVLAQVNVVGLAFRIIAFFFRIICEIHIFVFVNLGEIILSINSRSNELQADKFAHTIGYGREQISALYLLQKISINAKLTLEEKIKATHPHLAHRISYLENLEEGA